METEGNETELALQMILKAKPEMSPLQSGPVVFINQDLVLFPLALADTGFDYWFGFLVQNQNIREQRVRAVKFWDAATTKHVGF